MEESPTIRRATLKDLAAIIFIARASLGAPQWSDWQYKEILRAAVDANATRIVVVAEMRAQLRGFCVVSAAAGEAELESIVVAAGGRSQGLAKKLCVEAFAWAAERGAREVWLEVRQSNDAARYLYLSLGFVETGKRTCYYSEPKEDAVLMRTFLKGATHL